MAEAIWSSVVGASHPRGVEPSRWIQMCSQMFEVLRMDNLRRRFHPTLKCCHKSCHKALQAAFVLSYSLLNRIQTKSVSPVVLSYVCIYIYIYIDRYIYNIYIYTYMLAPPPLQDLCFRGSWGMGRTEHCKAQKVHKFPTSELTKSCNGTLKKFQNSGIYGQTRGRFLQKIWIFLSITVFRGF